MSKELNIIQAMEMPIGTEFIATNETFKTNLKINNDGVLTDDLNTEKYYISKENFNFKFIPVQKPVSFMEASDSLERIKVIYDKYQINSEYMNIVELIRLLNIHLQGSDVKLREVIHYGEWYIER